MVSVPLAVDLLHVGPRVPISSQFAIDGTVKVALGVPDPAIVWQCFVTPNTIFRHSATPE